MLFWQMGIFDILLFKQTGILPKDWVNNTAFCHKIVLALGHFVKLLLGQVVILWIGSRNIWSFYQPVTNNNAKS